MKRATLLVFLFAACGSEAPPPPLAWMPEESKPLAQLLAEFYGRYDAGYDRGLVRERVADIAKTLRERLFKPDDDPQRRRLAIGVYLLRGEPRFHFRKNAEGPLFRPDLVLKERRGNCLGLSTVFLLVAEELGLDAHAVLSPHPLHVVVDCGGHLFDLKEDGFERVPRSQRLLWREVGSSRRYGATFSKSEVVALHAISLAGCELLDKKPAPRVWELFRLAAEVDPNGAEAQFGLALAAYADEEWDLALERISRSVELNPLSESALLFKSELERLHGSQAAADAARERAEEIRGESKPEAPVPE